MPLHRLLKLRQRASEGLEEYYNRARFVLLDLHGDDGENNTPAPPQQSLRSIAVERFVSGSRDDWPSSGTRFWTRLFQQQILHDTVSLNDAFKMAEAVSKRMNESREGEGGRQREAAGEEAQACPRAGGTGPCEGAVAKNKGEYSVNCQVRNSSPQAPLEPPRLRDWTVGSRSQRS